MHIQKYNPKNTFFYVYSGFSSVGKSKRFHPLILCLSTPTLANIGGKNNKIPPLADFIKTVDEDK
jgi:hypothetical protein